MEAPYWQALGIAKCRQLSMCIRGATRTAPASAAATAGWRRGSTWAFDLAVRRTRCFSDHLRLLLDGAEHDLLELAVQGRTTDARGRSERRGRASANVVAVRALDARAPRSVSVRLRRQNM